jgi:hypothetical protein
MYEAVRHAAFISIARGSGFGGLALVTAMFGFAGNPALALKFGGFAALLATAILILKAWTAPQKPYKKTEVWLLLAPEDRPLDAYAQNLVSAARVEACYRFALIWAILATVFLTGGLILSALHG